MKSGLGAPSTWGRRRHRRGTALARGLVLAAAASAFVAGAPAGAAMSSRSSTSSTPGTHQLDGDTVPVVHHVGPTSFTTPGPFAIGETTLTLPTDGAPVEVWYPATTAAAATQPEATYDVSAWLPPALQKLIPAGFTGGTFPSGGHRDVAVAPGRFPLVLFSHGFAGFRDQSDFLTSYLATWGFVVAAPDHYSRDLTEVLGGPTGATAKTTDVEDLEATVTLLAHENATAGSPLHGHVDTTKVGAVGHSDGGVAVEALAAVDHKVATFIGLAGATVGLPGNPKHGPDSIVPHQPGLLMSGTADTVVPTAGMITAYGKMQAPKRLILVKGAGHLVFADICEIGAGQGGLLAIANVLKVPIPDSLKPLATDGCNAPDLPVTQGWPVVRQATVAQLRHVFGFDSSAAGLTGLVGAFPNVVSADESKS